MKKYNTQNLEDLENYLFQSVKERPRVPFSTEEVLQILKSYNPPDDLEGLRDESIVQVMKNAHQKRVQQEAKLKDPSLIQSLGELVRIACEIKKISPSKLAQVLGISKEEFEKYEKDAIEPAILKSKFLLAIMLFIGIPLNEMLQLVKRTINLYRIKQETNIAPTYTRARKDLPESNKNLVRDSATKELLLILKDEDEIEDDDFEKIKNELVSEYEMVRSELENSEHCYTIKTRERMNEINRLLQQL